MFHHIYNIFVTNNLNYFIFLQFVFSLLIARFFFYKMRIFKKAQFPINSITLLVILLVFIDTIVTREIENEAILDNLNYLKLRTRGQYLRSHVRPTNLSTAPYFGKRKDNLVALRNIHLERQSRRYQHDWFLELAQRYPIIARNYQWKILNGNDNGHSSNRQLSKSTKIP